MLNVMLNGGYLVWPYNNEYCHISRICSCFVSMEIDLSRNLFTSWHIFG